MSPKPKEEIKSDGDEDTVVTRTTQNDGPDLSVFHPRIRSSCAREQHAVWACRAVATGCGMDLSKLKRCFESVDNDNNTDENLQRLPQHIRVLTTPYTNYEGFVEEVASKDGTVVSLKQRIPCHDIQRQLGSCVTASGRELLQRKQQRERQQEQR